VNEGTFRSDLYYRLAVARIVLPPLRERPEDIEPLVAHLVAEITGDPSAQPFGWATLEALRAQHWTGNVRELRNVVETALAMGRLEVEGEDHGEVGGSAPQAQPSYREARAEAIARFERTYLSALIESTGSNASEAARRAKMDRPHLLALLRKHGLR
jgi:DNA-binding NtrC family response regulator